MTTLDYDSITPDVIAEHGLSGAEYRKILDILGRAPNITELGMFELWCKSTAGDHRWKLEFSVREEA